MSHLDGPGLWFPRLLFIMAVLLSGCAAQAPLMSAVEDRSAKTEPVPLDKAALYVFREPTFCAQRSLFSVAVDGRIVGWNANGTYYKLLLSPGFHELEAFGLVERLNGSTTIFSESKLALKLSAGNPYYVSQYSCFNDKLRKVQNAEGIKALTSMQLARFDTRNLSKNQIKEMVKRGTPIFEKPRTTSTETRAGNEITAGDLNADFTSILEGVGLALLLGLAMYGAAHSGTTTASAPLYIPPPERPAIVQRANVSQNRRPAVPAAVTNYVSTSGDMYHVSGNTVFSATRGERWTISGNTVRGTDGSFYRIIGDTIYSDSGQSYQRSGSSILGADGSVCTITGALINCK
jgi:hypothetical protein